MTIKQAIEKAIEGGYSNKDQEGWFIKLPEYAKCQIWLDLLFWQSLGKAMGWEGEDMYLTLPMDAHVAYWHRLIDHLAEGKTIEQFFAKL